MAALPRFGRKREVATGGRYAGAITLIAHAFGTAEGTVKNRVSSILSKLGARDRTRAVLRALEVRLL